MSIFESLEPFAAAGIVACAPALGIEVPAGGMAAAAGHLPAALRARGETEPFGGLLDALARDIWMNQEIRGIPHALAAGHAAALAQLLGAHPPAPQAVIAALDRASGGRDRAEPWRDVAADVAQRMAASGEVQRWGMSADVVGYLVHDLYRHLLIDAGVLPAFRGAIAMVVAQAAPTQLSATTSPPTALPAAPPRTTPAPARAATEAPARLPAPAATTASAPPKTAAPPPIPSTAPTSAPSPSAGAVATARRGRPRTGPLRPISARARAIVADRTGEAGAIAAIRHANDLSEPALGRFLAILDQREIAAADRMLHLEDMARWLKSTRALLLKPVDESPDIRSLKQEAAAALDAGGLETAASLLVEVRSLVRAERRESEQRLRAEIEALRHQSRAEAFATADMAQMALARLDLANAAALFVEAGETLPAEDVAQRLAYAMRAAEALDRAAEIDGSVETLRRALAHWQAAERLAHETQEDQEACLAAATLGRADALDRLGRTTRGIDALRAAAADYRDVQALLPRSDGPAVARQVDLRLGRTLLELARIKPDAAALDEAALRLDRAADELSRRDLPDEWASAQMLLGEALLAATENAPAGDRQPLVEQALAALEAAGEVFKREIAPGDWARLQVQLAAAHRQLAGADGEARRHWIAAAAALVPALEVFQALGDDAMVGQVRRALVDMRDHFEAAPQARTG